MAAFKDWLEKNSVSKQLKDIQASISSLQKEIEKLKESSGKEETLFNKDALLKRVKDIETFLDKQQDRIADYLLKHGSKQLYKSGAKEYAQIITNGLKLYSFVSLLKNTEIADSISFYLKESYNILEEQNIKFDGKCIDSNLLNKKIQQAVDDFGFSLENKNWRENKYYDKSVATSCIGSSCGDMVEFKEVLFSFKNVFDEDLNRSSILIKISDDEASPLFSLQIQDNYHKIVDELLRFSFTSRFDLLYSVERIFTFLEQYDEFSTKK